MEDDDDELEVDACPESSGLSGVEVVKDDGFDSPRPELELTLDRRERASFKLARGIRYDCGSSGKGGNDICLFSSAGRLSFDAGVLAARPF